jgi:O-antigen ligase
LATPLILSARTLFPFIVGKALASRSLIELLFGLWVVLVVLRPAYRPRRSGVLIAFAVWLAVSLLAGLTGVSIQRSLWSTYERMQGVIDLAHWFVLALVLASVLRPGMARLSWLPAGSSRGTRRPGAEEFSLSEYAGAALRSLLTWKMLLNANLVVSLSIALMGLNLQMNWGVDALQFYDELAAQSRMEATLGNATYVGAYMLVNVFLAAAFLGHSLVSGRTSRPEATAARRRRRRQRSGSSDETDWPVLLSRVFWIAVIGFDLWALVLSETRGSVFIGLPAGVLFFCVGYVLWGRDRAVKTALSLAVGAMVLLALLLVGVKTTDTFDGLADSIRIVKRFRDTNLDDSSIQARLASHKAGFEGFLNRPLLGWGPENYAVAFGRYFEFDPNVRETFDQAHNKLLEEMTTKGIMGLASYLALWTVMGAVVYRRVRNRDDDEQVFILLIGAALTGYFVQNLFLFDTPATVLQFAILVGFVAGLENTTEPAVVAQDGVSEEAATEKAASTPVRGWVLPAIGIISIIGVSALVALGIVINTRIYYASKIVVRTQEPTITWEQRADLFQKSIDTFRPLANYPRVFLIGQVSSNISRMSDDDMALMMDMIDREAVQATEGEPEEWKIVADLALLYYFAAAREAKYQEQADSYLESAIELGPETPGVMALRQLADLDEE